MIRWVKQMVKWTYISGTVFSIRSWSKNTRMTPLTYSSNTFSSAVSKSLCAAISTRVSSHPSIELSQVGSTKSLVILTTLNSVEKSLKMKRPTFCTATGPASSQDLNARTTHTTTQSLATTRGASCIVKGRRPRWTLRYFRGVIVRVSVTLSNL